MKESYKVCLKCSKKGVKSIRGLYGIYNLCKYCKCEIKTHTKVSRCGCEYNKSGCGAINPKSHFGNEWRNQILSDCCNVLVDRNFYILKEALKQAEE